MARPPRACFVYKKQHRYRYLPRPTNVMNYDYEDMMATPETFQDKLEKPPKLWVAWVYKNAPKEPRPVKEVLNFLFGEEFQLNKMKVFKNTPYWNDLLWRVKHLIELNPITFPNGEPTEADLNKVRLLPTGECLVDPKFRVDENVLQASNPENWTQIDEQLLKDRLIKRYNCCYEIQEDAPWTLSHRSDF